VTASAGPGSREPGRDPPPGIASGRTNGYSAIELLFVLGIAATTAGIAIPRTLAALDDIRTIGAVRYLASRIHQARMEAVVRSRSAGIRFAPSGASYSYAVFVDGNANGVRSSEIQAGVDVQVHAGERLPDHFAGVDFGALPGLPAVEPASPPPGSDPIRTGSSDLLTFTAIGTATPASLYVRGPRNAQYVVRVFGETGRTRVLKFDLRARRWRPL
jgi:type II secretory pathway pseudopilin PulG